MTKFRRQLSAVILGCFLFAFFLASSRWSVVCRHLNWISARAPLNKKIDNRRFEERDAFAFFGLFISKPTTSTTTKVSTQGEKDFLFQPFVARRTSEAKRLFFFGMKKGTRNTRQYNGITTISFYYLPETNAHTQTHIRCRLFTNFDATSNIKKSIPNRSVLNSCA